MELQVTDLMLVWFPSDYHELLQAKAEFPMMRWLPVPFTDCYWDTLVVIWSQEATILPIHNDLEKSTNPTLLSKWTDKPVHKIIFIL